MTPRPAPASHRRSHARGSWFSRRWWLARHQAVTTCLETRWVNPAYGGWVLGGLCLFFFAAASNTLAGWLYVMSGLGLSLLAVAAFLARRGLRHLRVSRDVSSPVSVGETLLLTLKVHNGDRPGKSLLQLCDRLPESLGESQTHALRFIGPNSYQTCHYALKPQRRGLYRWDSVDLRTAAPLGLCWYRKSFAVKAKAVVYPPMRPLSHCPLIDSWGADLSPQSERLIRARMASEGLTRSLRPYRWGDPMRMVHWRTSARSGELRVRELENPQASQALILAIDSGKPWPELPPGAPAVDPDWGFEQAVTVLASLYRYASRRWDRVQIWTASHGLIHGEQKILEALAAVEISPNSSIEKPRTACLWLTPDAPQLAGLPPGSRWLLWQHEEPGGGVQGQPGRCIDPTQPWVEQLQRTLN